MNGRLYIDGNDAFATYGVAVCKGGYDRLVEFPKPKAYTKNDWHERDGLELDNSEMKFVNRTFPVNFVCHGTQKDYADFLDMLSSQVYHTFNFAVIEYVATLRYVECSNYRQGRNFSTFTATFADDGDVFDGYAYSDPDRSVYGDTDNYFNFGRFRQFGLSILGNYKDELFKGTPVKKSLSISRDGISGLWFDGDDSVAFSQRTSKLHFLMQSDSWDDLWTRWKALLYNFAQFKWHDLTIRRLSNYGIDICLVSMNVEQLLVGSGKVMVKFALEVYTDTKEFERETTALESETEAVVVTEDGYLIEMV